jgi:hypothetical protein
MFKSWVERCTDPFTKRIFQAIISLFLFFFIAGCAPALYTIDIRYLSSADALPTDAGGRKFVVTVATFNDTRPGGEDLLIGRVTTAMGGLTNVIPKTMKPSDTVSTIVKDVLVKSGYQVSLNMPAWNLQENAIQVDWGKILIGGNIDDLEIICQNDIPIKTYVARVRLTMVIADIQTGKIIHQISTASNNSLEHVYFSEEMMGQQLSSAVTEAVEKAFESKILKEKIQNTLK